RAAEQTPPRGRDVGPVSPPAGYRGDVGPVSPPAGYGGDLDPVSPPAGYRTSRTAGAGSEERAVAPPRTTRWSHADSYGDDGYRDDAYTDDYDAHDDYSDAELDDLPQRRGCRRALVALVVLLVVAMVAGWFAWSWVQDKIDPSGDPGEAVLVDIPEGTSTAAVGDVLAEAEVITDAAVWDWYTKLRDVGTIQAGRYEMHLNSSFTEAIDDLKADPLPPEVAGMVTVPEGFTAEQVVARLSDPEQGVPGLTAEAVQQATADPRVRSAFLPANARSLEGTLFPDTYAYEEGETAVTMLQRMVREFDAVAEELQLSARAEAIGRTPYEVLTIASMVEREAGTPEDGPRVARVIYNRLAQDQPLGIDATSCYEKGEIPCELTTAELEDNSPYDTRNKVGLPPTPIASPGRAGIEAALSPADGDWLYYVLDADADDGSSVFTSDYDEFLAAKQRCIDAGLGCG
ncbi:MAG TPA: endolytic transglycosylase MltG, partial [Acidimicrobiales bacterium]|nr:endolytic transglycosylase MltG [Acidimicrobiales bacterium]